MKTSSTWEQSYVEQAGSVGPTLFVVEDGSQEPVYINVETGRTEMILECLESSSWPVLIPREDA